MKLNNLSFFALHTRLNTKSFVMEFFRSSGYKKSKGEKCVCVTVDMNKKLVEKLGYDILTHCTLTDESIHGLVSTSCTYYLTFASSVNMYDLIMQNMYSIHDNIYTMSDVLFLVSHNNYNVHANTFYFFSSCQ